MGRRSLPNRPGTCGGPGTGTATIDRNARTLCYSISTQNVALPLLAPPHPCGARR